MIYCLDTDILIEYFRGNESIKIRIENLREDDSIGLSWLSVYEFFKGIFDSGKLEEEGFLSALVNSSILMDETYESSRIGGEIYASLRKSGALINDADILIASIVKNHDAVLVTNNENHFKRIPGLKIENWLTS
ncbi:MAG: PIN domain-containing protein [Nitrospirae bacterium]|nr:PIN domain-containing protein [Nitrospirota bacterium]